MIEYFKKDDVHDFIIRWVKGFEPSPDKYDAAVAMLHNMHSIPVADIKPPVYAEWFWDPDGIDYNIGAWTCNNCYSKAETWWATNEKEVPLRCAGSHYCGNCGAIMRR